MGTLMLILEWHMPIRPTSDQSPVTFKSTISAASGVARAIGLLLCGAMLLGGCRPKQNAYVPPPPPEVTVARPIERMVPEVLVLTGMTRADQAVEVRARVRGYLEKKHVESGRRVKQGELLFTIDPREYQARARQAEADVEAKAAALRLAEITKSRMEQAVKSNAASQLELDRAMAERDAAAAQVMLSEAALETAQLDLEFTQIRAPIDGRIGFMPIDEGQLVGAGEATLLATIVNDAKIFATYQIDEQTLLRQRRQNENRRPGEDGRADMPVRMGLSSDSDFPYVGRYWSSDNTVDPQTGTIKVEAVFDNPNGAIIPGLFVKLESVLSERPAVLVPDVAVQRDQTGSFVLIVDDGNIVQRINVEAGPVFDRMRPVTVREGQKLAQREGESKPATAMPTLTTDSWVIVNGLQRARPGAKVVPLGRDGAVPAAPATTDPK